MFSNLRGLAGPAGWLLIPLVWTGMLALVVWGITRLFPDRAGRRVSPRRDTADSSAGRPRSGSADAGSTGCACHADAPGSLGSRGGRWHDDGEAGPGAGPVARRCHPASMVGHDGAHDGQPDT